MKWKKNDFLPWLDSDQMKLRSGNQRKAVSEFEISSTLPVDLVKSQSYQHPWPVNFLLAKSPIL